MNSIYKILGSILILFLIIVSFLYLNIFVRVDRGAYPIIIEIQSGESLADISDSLYQAKIIRNRAVFQDFLKVLGNDSKIKTGEYSFRRPMNNIELMDKLVNAKYEYTPVVLTITEGEDSKSITDKIYGNFKNISSVYTYDDLYKMLQAKEGYLFPETYSYAPWATLDDVLLKIDTEFAARTAKYNLTPEELKKDLTIASILEKEVPNPADMKIVSGIIQNRLKIGMRLQMDSTLGYITDKASLQLDTEDLQIDSLYNTYKVSGLPPTPIGNPGDVSIDAAINPDVNDYLYFLSDKDGVNHYTKSYAEHLQNRKEYLGK